MDKTLTRRQLGVGASAALGVIASSGAIASAQSTAMSEAPFDPFNVKSGEKQFVYKNIINNDAVNVDLPIGVINGTKDGPTVAISAGIFATEYCGVEAASRLYQDIDPKDIKGRLIILPVINMPAFQFRNPGFVLANGNNPIDGKSVNSCFPGDKDGSVSDVIAYHVFQEIVSKADYLIDLRGGDVSESHLLHTMFANQASEKVNRISRDMAKATGFKYYQSRGLKPGSLYGEAIAAGIPAMIVQSGVGYKVQPEEQNVMHHINAVNNVMKHIDMMEGTPSPAKEQQELASHFVVVKAKKSGIFQAIEEPGLLVSKGRMIGKITSLDGSVLEEIIAPDEGVLHTVFVKRVVMQGDTLAYILQFAK